MIDIREKRIKYEKILCKISHACSVWVNDWPRKCLGFKTPKEMMDLALAA